MESAGSDKENVVGANHAIAGVDGGAFDDGQNVALHAFAGNIWTVAGFAPRNFIDLIDKDDAHLLGALDRRARHLIHIEQLVLFFLNQVLEGVGHAHLALLFLLPKHTRKHVLDIYVHLLDALIGDDLERGHGAFAHFDFHQVAHHGFHVAADVADFGVFRSLHFHKRAAGEASQAPRDLRFADAGRADHQNIFRQDVFRNFGWQLLAAHAVAQCHGDGAFRCILPDDILVELRHDFARRHVVERGKKLFSLRRRGAIASGRQNYFFFRLAWHESFCSSPRDWPTIPCYPLPRYLGCVHYAFSPNGF